MRTQFGNELRYQEIVSTGPGSLPVHVNAAKLHARIPVDLSVEDADIIDKIREATRAVEKDSGRALVVQTRKLYLDRWPQLSPNQIQQDILPSNDVEIRGCPVISATVTYTDNSGNQQNWSAFQINTADEPARLRYVWGGYWPTTRLQEKSICITYLCGYAIPYTVASSTLTLSGIAPVNGSVYRVSNSGGLIPSGLAAMTDYYVINASGQTCQLSTSLNGSAISIANGGTGLQFLGEIDPRAIQAIYLRVALAYADREGAEFKRCEDGYWSKIYALRYEGW